MSTGDNEKDKELELEEVKRTSDIYNDFLEFYNRKRIYLPKETCKKLDELREEAYNCLWEYNAKNQFGFTDRKLNFENHKSAADRAKNKIPSIKESLEDDFRGMIRPKGTAANSGLAPAGQGSIS